MTVFVAVAEEAGFAAAARRLNLSPPSITRAVSELETRLGAGCFTTTRSVRLTGIRTQVSRGLPTHSVRDRGGGATRFGRSRDAARDGLGLGLSLVRPHGRRADPAQSVGSLSRDFGHDIVRRPRRPSDRRGNRRCRPDRGAPTHRHSPFASARFGGCFGVAGLSGNARAPARRPSWQGMRPSISRT